MTDRTHPDSGEPVAWMYHHVSDPDDNRVTTLRWSYVAPDWVETPLYSAPVQDFRDAYQGAMEEMRIWKKRALEAEETNRKFIAELNGPTYMGEPAPVPSRDDTELLRQALDALNHVNVMDRVEIINKLLERLK